MISKSLVVALVVHQNNTLAKLTSCNYFFGQALEKLFQLYQAICVQFYISTLWYEQTKRTGGGDG